MVSIPSKVIIGKVLSVNKHQNADKLYVTSILLSYSDNATVDVVTGASNINVGDFVPILLPGELIPGPLLHRNEKVVLQQKTIRGIVSAGMLLSELEIGIGEDNSGIFIINKNLHKLDTQKFKTLDDLVGKSLFEYLNNQILVNLQLLVSHYFSSSLATDIKLNLIKRNLCEIVGEEELYDIVKNRDLTVYWGTAPTGKPSIGYLLPLLKISDFLKAGCHVTILLANLHAYLDNMKSSWEQLDFRTEYYKILLYQILQTLDAPLFNLKFVIGTDFQLDKQYTLDMYKISSITTVASVKGAGTEVVKQVENPVLGSLLYPILQALDEEYLQVDAQLGGIDQRKIFMYAREYLPKLGYKKRIHFMHPLIPSLSKGGKMSSSDPDSKIDFEDTNDEIHYKISKAFSVDGTIEGNSLMYILKYIIFAFLQNANREFYIERPMKWGGDISYSSYEDLEKDFIDKKISSVDIKPAIARELNRIVSPIRNVLLQHSELIKKAYPK
ncbi:MAG: tyrosine--tRNA ligase [Candidatus Dojkabacteria bacterium]|nr:tyrosine--tRNA ligase [Candidatus Dojkabacteria bacterium]